MGCRRMHVRRKELFIRVCYLFATVPSLCLEGAPATTQSRSTELGTPPTHGDGVCVSAVRLSVIDSGTLLCPYVRLAHSDRPDGCFSRVGDRTRPPDERARQHRVSDDAQMVAAFAKVSSPLEEYGPTTQVTTKPNEPSAAGSPGRTAGVPSGQGASTTIGSPGKTTAAMRQGAMLDQARRLLRDGKKSEAMALALEVVKNAESEAILTEADKVLAVDADRLPRLRRWSWAIAEPILRWLTAMLLVVLIVAVAILLLRISRRVCVSRWPHERYWIAGFIDRTELGLQDYVWEQLRRCNTQSSEGVTAGLLFLERVVVLAPSVEFREDSAGVDLAQIVESLPSVGGVELSRLAKSSGFIKTWWYRPIPSLSGSAFIADECVHVRLTKQQDGDRVSVFATEQIAGNRLEAARSAAQEVSFKMYYMLTRECLPPEAETANKLRDGVEALSRYISARSSEDLKKAVGLLMEARCENPTSMKAHLYEGIALDLSEKHDEAIEHFGFVREQSADAQLKQKALYNEAVSHFRKYVLEEFDEAASLFREIVGNSDVPSADNTPIQALAWAGIANTKAHRLMFWGETRNSQPVQTDSEILEQKKSRVRLVQKCIAQVQAIVRRLRKVNTRGNSWDDLARQQLEWAIENASGNMYLNAAKDFLCPPRLEPDWGERRQQQYLEKAVKHFHKCELLLPPGVETLTNLATASLYQGKRAAAREYARRAIALNPDYEYAYYRLAQAWKDDACREKVVETLRSFGKTPRISGFQKLFHEFYVEPKTE
jgi:tetratricopeptide (TPR) repeat protein